MTDSHSEIGKATGGYTIGAISRLTGLSLHVIRIWEKRYQAVRPDRTETGRRVYFENDLDRLRLLKVLVDNGQAISSIAGLSDVDLRARVDALVAGEQRRRGRLTPVRATLIGSVYFDAADEWRLGERVRIAACYENVDEAARDAQRPRSELVVFDVGTVYPGTSAETLENMTRLGATHAVVSYRYASKAAVALLRNVAITGVQGRIDADRLLEVVARVFCTESELGAGYAPVPLRLFTARQLSRLAAQSSAVECECPRHLSELILDLSRFEDYSARCESLNTQDARLHASLYAATATARSLLEGALQQVIKLEGLDPGDGESSVCPEDPDR